MGKIVDATFEGKYGTYAFEVFTTDTIFNPVGAVYIFSKRDVGLDGTGTHTFLYIGETHSLGERIPNHDKWQCVNNFGVNCICIHIDNDGNSRLRKEIDLRAVNKTPCNAQQLCIVLSKRDTKTYRSQRILSSEIHGDDTPARVRRRQTG